MALWKCEVFLATLLLFVAHSEAATPLFLQAITSALATIPFTGGPMTTGLVGAKLGIGAKLLYYLGFFGSRSKPSRSKAKPAVKAAATQKFPLPTRGSSSFSGIQPVPLPYMFSGGGGYPGMGSNFQQTPSSQASSGLDPAQLFQILTSQGVDPNVVMEALNYAGASAGNAGFGTSGGFGAGGTNGFGTSGGFGAGGFAGGNNAFGAGGFGGGNPEFGTGFGAGSINTGFGSSGGLGSSGNNAGFGMDTGFSQNVHTGQNANLGSSPSGSSINSQTENGPDNGGSEEDVESFFTFMQDMDENTCISRLICDIGHDPSFLGDFSENIHGMVNSLEVQPSSRAYQYIQIMKMGRKDGDCGDKFPECTDMSYEIVKNVAPSVSLPQNVNADAINSL